MTMHPFCGLDKRRARRMIAHTYIHTYQLRAITQTA